MKYCSSCGGELKENQDVCLGCGKVIKKETVKANAEAGAKSKMAAGLLGIFLGCFGVHNFYLGYTGKAIAQLLITVLSCGILAIVSLIWSIIEAIQILTGSINVDAKGNPLVD